MSEEPKNITEFKEMAGRILGVLYKNHPKDQWLDASQIYDDENVDDDTEELFDNTLSYLIENGYLTQTDSSHVRLNDRSYHLLQKPNPLDSSQNIGETLAGWVKNTASEAGKGLVMQTVTSALALLYSAIVPS